MSCHQSQITCASTLKEIFSSMISLSYRNKKFSFSIQKKNPLQFTAENIHIHEVMIEPYD